MKQTTDTTARFWIAVASAEHARKGRTQGFMQVGHGKGGPLRRVRAGDGVVYYAPTATFAGKDRLQAFVSIGTARDGDVYQVEMEEGFRPFRRDVAYAKAKEAPIQPLLDRLELTRGKRNWGYAFRFGLVEISSADFAVIAAAMQASLPARSIWRRARRSARNHFGGGRLGSAAGP